MIRLIFKSIVILLLLMAMFHPASLDAQVNPQGRKTLESELLVPAFVMDFQQDYASFKLERIMNWISPRRGLVEDGILMSYEYTEERLKKFEKEMSELKNPQLTFLRGYYNGNRDSGLEGSMNILEGRDNGSSQKNNFYKAFYQLTFKLGKVNQKINLIMVFEKLDDKSYLVQTQNLRLSRGNQVNIRSESLSLPTDKLTIGDKPLDYEGVTFSKTKKSRRFASEMAQRRIRPVLLNFFTKISLDVGMQLDWAESLYPKFKGKNIYIFCVSDDEPDHMAPYLESAGWKIVVLRDPDSLIHMDLEIDIHPYILLLDHWGVVRSMSRGYNQESLELVEKIMAEVIDEADSVIAFNNASSPPVRRN